MIQPRQTLSPLPDPTCGYVTGLGQFPPSPASVSPVVAWGLPSARLMSSREAGRAWHSQSSARPGSICRPALWGGAWSPQASPGTRSWSAQSKARGSHTHIPGLTARGWEVFVPWGVRGGGVHGRVLGLGCEPSPPALGVPAPAGRAAQHLCHPWGLLFNVQPTLSIIAKKKKKPWKQPKSPSTGERRNELWLVHPRMGTLVSGRQQAATPGTRGGPPRQHARGRSRTWRGHRLHGPVHTAF